MIAPAPFPQNEPVLLTELFETKYRPLRLAGKSITGVRHHREMLRRFSAFLVQQAADVLSRVESAEVTPEPAKKVPVVKLKLERPRLTGRRLHRRKGPPKTFGPRDATQHGASGQNVRRVSGPRCNDRRPERLQR